MAERVGPSGLGRRGDGSDLFPFGPSGQGTEVAYQLAFTDGRYMRPGGVSLGVPEPPPSLISSEGLDSMALRWR